MQKPAGIRYKITKTKNGTYRLRIYIPEEARSSLGTGKKVIEKRFKLRSEAKKYELDMLNKIDKILQKHLLKSYQYVIIYPNGIELILILAEGEV